MKKKSILLSIFAIFSFILVACGGTEDASVSTEVEQVKVGVFGDIDANGNQQWQHIAEVAGEEGIEIEFVSLSDYVTPNTSLAAGDIDMNAFQTVIHMESFIDESGEDFVSIGDTTFNPLGFFSNKISDVSEIEEGFKVTIPNDASQGGRALVLLQTAGLITVDPDKGLLPTPEDVIDNPLNLEITPVEANQTARALDDVDFSVINNDVATNAGLVPSEDAFYRESVSEETKPYINVLTVRREDENNETLKRIVEIYHTDEVKEIIKESTKGSSIPAW